MSKFNVGDKVKYIGKNDEVNPEWYPPIGTVGIIKSIVEPNAWVKWPDRSTSGNDCWCCSLNSIEKIVENMTNEEIWEMLKLKMEKNGVKSKASIINSHIDDYPNNEIKIIKAYYESDVANAIAIAYRSGYERAMKGRPFKFGEKKKKKGHWEPVDPNNLPKEGTKVRYSRKNIDWSNSTYVEIGDTGTVQFWESYFGFNLDVSKGLDWICILTQADCLDMWVEDDE